MASSITPTETLPASLAAGAVHDLRNVLFIIRAYSERLLTDLDPSDARAADLHAIHDIAQRGVELAREMIAEVRTGGAPAERVDVSDVICRVLPLLTRLAGERIEVVTALAGAAWPVTANAVQIEQIVMNLVTNARDAMPQGGRVVIRTENRPAGSPGGYDAVVISVADNGIGIDPDIRERIFDPYFTTREAEGGTGVGLATVRTIARIHGGEVEVASAPGQGATFSVVLPRAGAPALAAPAEEAGCAGARVLLIENEQAIRHFVQRLLVAEGFDVRTAADGREALRACDAAHPLDVVVSDVHLPDLQGPEVVRRLKELCPAVQVVFMSGSPGAADLAGGGTVPVLAKPFTTSELVSAVRTVLRDRPVR